MRNHVSAGVLAVGLLFGGAAAVRADEIPAEYRPAVEKGLDYLVKHQHKDGHWEEFGGMYPVAMTGISGMALLAEGSTIREGRFRDNIRRACDYLMSKAQPN